MSGRIFISYRRVDSQYATDQIYDQLVQHFGIGNVFMDIDTIPLGVNFREYIDQQVSTSDIVLAVIGDHWLTATDPEGNPRLDNPNDFVRLEIEAALKQGIKLIPLFIGGVQSLPASRLPEGMRELPMLNATRIRRSTDFIPDVMRLIRALETIRAEQAQTCEKHKAALIKVQNSIPELTEKLNRLQDLSTRQKRQQKKLQDEIETFTEQLSDLLASPAHHLRLDLGEIEAQLESIEDQIFDLELQIEEDKKTEQLAAVRTAREEADEERRNVLLRENQRELEAIRLMVAEILTEMEQFSDLALRERRNQAAIKRNASLTLRTLQRILESRDDLVRVDVELYREEFDELKAAWLDFTTSLEERKFKEESEEKERKEARERAARESERKIKKETQEEPQRQAIAEQAKAAPQPATVSLKPRADIGAKLKMIPVWVWGAAVVLVLGAAFGPILWKQISNLGVATPDESNDVSATPADGIQLTALQENILSQLEELANTTPDFWEDFSLTQAYWSSTYFNHETYLSEFISDGVAKVTEEPGSNLGYTVNPTNSSDYLLNFDFTPITFEDDATFVFEFFKDSDDNRYHFDLSQDGSWAFIFDEYTLSEGQIPALVPGRTYQVQFYSHGMTLRTLAVWVDGRLLEFRNLSGNAESTYQISFEASSPIEVGLDNFKLWDLTDNDVIFLQPLIDQKKAFQSAAGFYQPIREYLFETSPTFEEDFETPREYWDQTPVDNGTGLLSDYVTDGMLQFEDSDPNYDLSFYFNIPDVQTKSFAIQYDYRYSNPGSANYFHTAVVTTWEQDGLPVHYISYCDIHQGQQAHGCGFARYDDLGARQDIFDVTLNSYKEIDTASTLLAIFNQGQVALFLDGYFMGYASDLEFLDQWIAIETWTDSQEAYSVEIDNIKYWDLTYLDHKLNSPDEFQPIIDHLISADPTFEEDFKTPQAYWEQMQVNFSDTKPVDLAALINDGEVYLNSVDELEYDNFVLNFPELSRQTFSAFAIQYDFRFNEPGPSTLLSTSLQTAWGPEGNQEYYNLYCDFYQDRQEISCGLYEMNDSGKFIEVKNFNRPFFQKMDEPYSFLAIFYQDQIALFLNGYFMGQIDNLELVDQQIAINFGNNSQDDYQVRLSSIKFWNLTNLYEDLEVPSGFQPVIDHIQTASPTFEDDFSTAKEEWGLNSKSRPVTNNIQEGILVVSSGSEDQVEFPINGLFSGSEDLAFEFDLIHDPDQYPGNGIIEIVVREDKNTGAKYSFKLSYSDYSLLDSWVFTQSDGTDIRTKNSGPTKVYAAANHVLVILYQNKLAVFLNGNLLVEANEVESLGLDNNFIHYREAAIGFDNFKFWNLDGLDLEN